MNELATIPRISDLPAPVLKQFTKTELMYISLTEAEKFSQIEENRLPGMLLPVIEYTYRTLGHGYDGKLAAIMATDLSIILKKYHSQSTMEELREAVSKGTIGKYGETKTAVSAAMIEGWLVRYKDEISLEKKLALKKLKDLTEVKTNPTQDELRKIDDECIQTCFDHWQKTGEIVNLGNEVFRTLWKQGKIKFSPEKAAELKQQAREILTAELIEKRQKAKDKLNKTEVKKIEVQMMEIEEDENTRVAITAGSIAIREYFEKVK